MGLLDSKTRVMDTVMTLEGRRQLADGSLRLGYISFTDGAAFYKADIASGSADATARVYFEAQPLPADQITFKASADGRLQPFPGVVDRQFVDGHVIAYLTGAQRTVSGEEFLLATADVLSSSIDNFKRLYVLGSRDTLFEDDGFAAGPSSVTFTLTDDRPIRDSRRRAANLNELDSLFNDPRFSRLPNFQHLPPVNKARSDGVTRPLGYYPPWGPTTQLDFGDLMHELQFFSRLGFSKTIRFDPTSRGNRLLAQVFELSYDVARKLDVVDFGTFSDAEHRNAHVFFVGRVMTDDRGADTFLHLFTLVFE